LIKSDSEPESKLKSFILKFFSIIEFDVKRKHKTISEKEVDWYSQTIGEAVTDCIEHFIDHDTDHPPSKNRYKAAMAAHIVHSLRDLKQDIQNGYINIPQEYLKEHGIDIGNYQDEQIAGWIRKRVAVAHRYFCDGKSYISTFPFSRRRLAAALYCLRFKPLLKIIEKDRYLLRNNYQMGMSFIIKSLLTL
jgi:phytoene/squalene synthetase